MGDVILTTPIIERLSQQYDIINFQTRSPQVLENNPHIDMVYGGSSLCEFSGYDKIFELDLAYEKRPKMHIIDAYSMEAFGDTETSHICKLYEDKYPKEDYIVFHMAQSWENRTWHYESWVKLWQLLTIDGHQIKLVGAGDDFNFGPSENNLVGKQTFWELVSTIQRAKLFVGMDSGPLHIAQAVSTDSVGIFTCAVAVHRAHSHLTDNVAPKIDCYGCLHAATPPVTYIGCKRGDFKCLNIITPEQVYEKIKWRLEWNQLQKKGLNPAPVWKGPMPKYPVQK